MSMKDYYSQSIELHKKHGGKIATATKVPLETRDDLSIAYSPGVAAVCKEIAQDSQKAKELTIKKNTIAIVSDGSAILGIGNLGAKAAIPVMEGKAALLKAFADVDAFPICLDTQDPEEIIETVKRIAPVFGGINLEDIAAPQCFEIEERLKKELDIPVMHDDQHGTAIVTLAGLINALKLRNSQKEDVKIVVNGAGSAGVAITKMLLTFGLKNVLVSDSKGAIYEGRKTLSGEKEKLATMTNLACRIDIDDPRCAIGGLEKIIQGADVFIGVSKGGLLTKEMVQSMAKDPIIFALANPEPEIMPDDAKEAGAFVVATGRSDFPNQINNVLAFPGLFRGVLDAGAKSFTEEMFVLVAESIASHVEKPRRDKVVPDALDKTVAQVVAEAVKKVCKTK
ncbi:MAG: NADP-dependent malic enzyme [Candidatus Moranbacteria bacterium]|nr:NADP-dependent malic enzyme [Candidatus Moranbacteria bacterium]